MTIDPDRASDTVKKNLEFLQSRHCKNPFESKGITIQNGSSRSLISQSFLPESDTNRRSQRTLRNKRFFGASDTTTTLGAALRQLRQVRQGWCVLCGVRRCA